MNNGRTRYDVGAERKAHIEHMLSCVQENMEARGQENDFIESLSTQFEERGTLTDNQVRALAKFYDRID